MEIQRRSNSSPILIFDNEDWLYVPDTIPHAQSFFNQLMKEVKDKVSSYMVTSAYTEDKEFPSRRLSCVFGDRKRKSVYGESLPIFAWEASPTLECIKKRVETILRINFDYCLCHLYRSGDDTISWHSDKEGIHTLIASVSLGATRKFRLRRKGETKGWTEEFKLESGQMIVMKPSCQRKFVHCVPVERKVKEPRINLTFRQADDRI